MPDVDWTYSGYRAPLLSIPMKRKGRWVSLDEERLYCDLCAHARHPSYCTQCRDERDAEAAHA